MGSSFPFPFPAEQPGRTFFWLHVVRARPVDISRTGVGSGGGGGRGGVRTSLKALLYTQRLELKLFVLHYTSSEKQLDPRPLHVIQLLLFLVYKYIRYIITETVIPPTKMNNCYYF